MHAHPTDQFTAYLHAALNALYISHIMLSSYYSYYKIAQLIMIIVVMQHTIVRLIIHKSHVILFYGLNGALKLKKVININVRRVIRCSFYMIRLWYRNTE